MKAIILLLMLLCLPIGGRGQDFGSGFVLGLATGDDSYQLEVNKHTIDSLIRIIEQLQCRISFQYHPRRWCLPEERPTTRRNNYIWGDTLWIHFSNGDSIMNR